MVRASTHEPSDDSKDAVKKKSASKKKPVVTGIWPCKMNGCTKQFAREADLKRHQRTTKLHSMPNFACPQCDATFTRTDALRRHQKSRHNGVVIEPSDQETKTGAENDAGTSESHSKSRSATPSSKGKERASVSNPAPAQPDHAGRSSYYRQHTAMSTPYVPPRPVVMDPHYAQVALPTSATRLNVAANWTYPPHPWPDGAHPPMGYPIPSHLYYSSHYRSNGVTPQLLPNVGPHQNGSATQPPASSHSDSSPTDTRPPSNTSDPSGQNPSTVQIIHPSLNSSVSTTLTDQQVLAITEAAVKAVLEAEAGSSRTASRSGSVLTSLQSEGETGERVEEVPETSSVMEPRLAEKTGRLPGYGTALERPEPMEHMLTEDGEPMLNPAELLTQESLASPPPS